MEVELPAWLDHAFLASVLQGKEAFVPVTVKRFSATSVVTPGNNYMSQLYRLKVEYKKGVERKCTLIIKAPFTKGIMIEMMDQCDFYDKEPKVYKELLPILNSYIKGQLGPQSYVNPYNNALVLTDLSEQGFVMCDRFKQLDFAHCEQVLKALAKFHASSVACKRDRPDIIDLVGKEIYYTNTVRYETDMKVWMEGSLNIVADVVREMELPNLPEEFILSRVEKVAYSGIRLCKPKTTGLNVLNHGDLSGNNVLFKYSSSGEIYDLRFIDFQIVRYATPVLDLIYFVWTSANEEVRENRIQELFEIYRSTLNTTLEELGCKERLPAEELFNDIKGAVDWVLITVCNIMPIIFCPPEDFINNEEVSYEEIIGGQDERFTKIYHGRHYKKMLPKLMANLHAWRAYYK